MSRFKGKNKESQPEISTAALPDIIFMLLFFFMVVAQEKQADLKIKVELPQASELEKLEKKESNVAYINIGKPLPRYQDLYGKESTIQLNDKISKVTDIQNFAQTEKSESPNGDVIMSFKIDGNTKMGIVTDVKTELRKADQLRIHYAAERSN